MSRLSKYNKAKRAVSDLAVKTKNSVQESDHQPEDFIPDIPPLFRPAFLDGWLGDTWKTRLYGSNAYRVLIYLGKTEHTDKLILQPLSL